MLSLGVKCLLPLCQQELCQAGNGTGAVRNGILAFHLGKEATDIGGGVVAVAISVHGAAEARQRRPFCVAL